MEDLFSTPGQTGVATMPGFPAEWKDKPLNPDGTLNAVDAEQPYSLPWLKKWRVRQLFVETDLLYQFANMVAAESGRPTDQYFRGGASAIDSLESLMVNVVASSLHRQNAMTIAANASVEEMEKSLKEKVQDFSKTVPIVAAALRKERLGRAYAGSTYMPEYMREEAQRTGMDPAVKRQQEAMFSAAMRKLTAPPDPRSTTLAASDKPGSGGAGGSRKPAEMVAPAVAPGRRVEVAETVLPRSDMTQPPPVQTYRILTPEELRAQQPQKEKEPEKAEQASAPTSADAALDNPKTLLLYLLLRGGINETERKVVAQIYGPPELLLDDPERRERELKDMEQMERLLRRHAPDVEYLNAPQHTGVIFFSPRMVSAVRWAMNVVHHVCGKPFALEIDLMTHAEVCQRFAQLVANHIKSSESSRVSRFGGGRDQSRELQREYGGLVELFRSLRTVTTTDEKGDHIDVLSFSKVVYGHSARLDMEKARAAYMDKRDRYYSDQQPQRRPFNPEDYMM